MDAGRGEHTPALVQEVLNGLNIRPAGVYVDCTFGRGGHAEAILKRLGEEGHLLAIDKDPEAVAAAQDQFASDGRFAIEQGSYTMLLSLVQKHSRSTGAKGEREPTCKPGSVPQFGPPPYYGGNHSSWVYVAAHL